jgi:tRNA uridine 5-carboxymethylaminomethyl modification enzyme
VNSKLEELSSAPISQKTRLINILSRPNIGINDLRAADGNLDRALAQFDQESIEQAEILMKYEGYIGREKENADKLKRLEEYKISPDFDFTQVGGLGAEAKEKLKKFQPQTIGQASRISGINPADVSVLLVHLGR